MQELYERNSEIKRKIQSVSDPIIRRDLLKMLFNATGKITDLSRESVNCRRLNRVTREATNLIGEIDEYHVKIEKYLTLYLMA